MNAIDFSDYKFRSHASGKIMVGVKPNLTEKQEELLEGLIEKKETGRITDKQMITLGKLLEKRHAKPELSKSVQSYLKELHREEVFGIRNDITSKYLDKGIQAEEKSLSLLCSTTGNWYQKNKERFTNDFITGEPDNVQGKIRDIKSSWNFATFPMYDNEVPDKNYYWQLQCYMALTGMEEAELIYCLVDTPFKIIEDELRRMDWKFDILDGNGDVRTECIDLVVEMVSGHIFSEKGLKEFCHQSPSVKKEWFTEFSPIPDPMRMKIFQVERNDEDIESLYNQILMCREFMNDITLQIGEEQLNLKTA